MAHKVHRKTNDGNYTGIKQDKFRNSGFEYEDKQYNRFGGVSRATPNTINGKWAENRGRRGDQLRQDNPFENGKLHNWNRRQGWDQYYETRDNGYRGKGPRGFTRKDSRIYDDVCELLTRDRSVDAGQVDVSVEDGVVTLTGKVEDRDMKRYAGNIIDRIPGVKDIHNLLEFDRR